MTPSEPMLIGLISLGGAILGALLTSMLQPLWAAIISPKSNIHVLITPYYLRLPKFLTDGISEYIYNYKLNIRPNEDFKDRLREIKTYSGHFGVEISNKSKSSISDVVLRLSDNSSFFADVQDAEKNTYHGKAFELGTLQPESKVTIHIWAYSDASRSRWTKIRDLIVVRAASYDKISVDVGISEGIQQNYVIIPKFYTSIFWKTFWILIFLLSVVSILYQISPQQ